MWCVSSVEERLTSSGSVDRNHYVLYKCVSSEEEHRSVSEGRWIETTTCYTFAFLFLFFSFSFSFSFSCYLTNCCNIYIKNRLYFPCSTCYTSALAQRQSARPITWRSVVRTHHVLSPFASFSLFSLYFSFSFSCYLTNCCNIYIKNRLYSLVAR